MRGQLKTLILKLIVNKPLSGSEIAKEIEKTYNWKPSSGSLYPMLDHIEKELLTTSTIQKNKKIYKITTKGKQELKKLQKNKDTLISYIKKSHALMKEVYGIEENLEEEFLKKIKSEDLPIQDINQESTEMKKELFRILSQKNYKQNKTKLKQTLKNMVAELKKIK